MMMMMMMMIVTVRVLKGDGGDDGDVLITCLAVNDMDLFLHCDADPGHTGVSTAHRRSGE